METRINSVEALEAVIGKTPPPVQLKVIDHLDDGALRWLAVSPLMFAGFGEGASLAITVGGGARGFACGDAHSLRLPLAALDNPVFACPGSAVGALFLAPGIGETLRINGRVAEVQEGNAIVAVDECYVHCAKALIRSSFWSSQPADAPTDVDAFVAASRFMALATVDSEGRADLSPKGDPAGSMARINGGNLWFAERPGNRRADSFRNIIAQPRITAALLIPGSSRIGILAGNARLTTEEAMRRTFTHQGKTPLLATCVEDLTLEFRHSPALERAGLWPVTPVKDINPAQMLVAHVKANRDKGVGARLAGTVMSIPGLMQKGLDKDYRDNLY
ncbi:pyridoxamine 5'-phosphate oxidase family protein [Sandaracinobacteroides hominis]|uniref:pyridoxamine 5'-phosphate oxidase family protein n=1 Tax=Sandaracinobacteroides hominis TaxID=2780086 RepID=UPI0018F67C88|nr:pyridoxamine 5'-phosphate oxidase family protein [Sandaracinobacteroides hominis]